MKVQIEIDENCVEEEVIIRCSSLTNNVQELQKMISVKIDKDNKINLFKNNEEYYLPIEELLFFETAGDVVSAHTVDDIFFTKLKLYELEKILPWKFSRISKSGILNIDKVYSITRNLTASSVVKFRGTMKQVYVSRIYYQPLRNKLEEKRKM